MPDYGHELRLGVFITPAVDTADEVIGLAEEADALGLDLVSFQDHPYQRRYLDTGRCSLRRRPDPQRAAGPERASLPLRPPAVLAKSVASLDRLSGGRVELASAPALLGRDRGYGGRSYPGQSVEALEEAST